MARKVETLGSVRVATVLVALAAGGVVALINIPRNAAAEPLPAAIAKSSADAVEAVKKPATSRMVEFKQHLGDAQQLKQQLASSENDPKVRDHIAEAMAEHAKFFQSFASDEAEVATLFADANEEVKVGNADVAERIAQLEVRKSELDQKAAGAAVPEEKRGYVVASKMVDQRIGLWKALGKANASVSGGLDTAAGQMKRLFKVAESNAAVFAEASQTIRLAADMQRSSEILRDLAGADIDELIGEMESTWKVLTDLTTQMASDARQLAEIGTA